MDKIEVKYGPNVHQKARKFDETSYFVIYVHTDEEKLMYTFVAYDIENMMEEYPFAISHSEFEKLPFGEKISSGKTERDEKFDWVIVRLEFSNDAGGRKLKIGNEPMVDEPDLPSQLSTGRMTYAQRQRLRHETEKLDEKRAQNIAAKSDKARKAFLNDLHDAQKLDQLKLRSRQDRIDKERAERNDTRALQKRLADEKAAQYKTNEAKRNVAIAALEKARAVRDEARITKVIQEQQRRKLERTLRIDEAIQRKRDEQEKVRELEKEQAERQAGLEQKRERHIRLRKEAQVQRERSYLLTRQQAIDEGAKMKQLKAERKAQYLYQKSSERAKRLKETTDQAAEWERLEDQRQQAELKREYDRNMQMVSHINDLKALQEKIDLEQRQKVEAALERRRDAEKAQLDKVAAENKRMAEIEEQRSRKIAEREAVREQRNIEYVESIRHEKNRLAARGREKAQQLCHTRERNRDERAEKRRTQKEDEKQNFELQKRRDVSIQERNRKRDMAELEKLKKWRDCEDKKRVAIDSSRMQIRFAEKEKAQKQQEDNLDKSRQWVQLEQRRLDNQEKKVNDRLQREKARMQTSTA